MIQSFKTGPSKAENEQTSLPKNEEHKERSESFLTESSRVKSPQKLDKSKVPKECISEFAFRFSKEWRR